MESLNISNKRLFISVLNNLAGINPTVVIDEGTNYISVRDAEMYGRKQAIVKFKGFSWTNTFHMNDVTKLTNAMASLPDSDVILTHDNIVIKRDSTEYNILYSEYFNDKEIIDSYKVDQVKMSKLCVKENLVYEFILSNDEINLIRNSEKILNFKNKYIFIIDKDGFFNGNALEGDKLVTYNDTFRICPDKIIFNDLSSFEENLSIELSDFVFLPKYDYNVKVYSYLMQDRRKNNVRCFTIEVSYKDDEIDLTYYINTQAFIPR